MLTWDVNLVTTVSSYLCFPLLQCSTTSEKKSKNHVVYCPAFKLAGKWSQNGCWEASLYIWTFSASVFSEEAWGQSRPTCTCIYLSLTAKYLVISISKLPCICKPGMGMDVVFPHLTNSLSLYNKWNTCIQNLSFLLDILFFISTLFKRVISVPVNYWFLCSRIRSLRFLYILQGHSKSFSSRNKSLVLSSMNLGVGMDG